MSIFQSRGGDRISFLSSVTPREPGPGLGCWSLGEGRSSFPLTRWNFLLCRYLVKVVMLWVSLWWGLRSRGVLWGRLLVLVVL